jgi:hypothetical protein
VVGVGPRRLPVPTAKHIIIFGELAIALV